MDEEMASYKKLMPEKHVEDLSNMVIAPMPGLVKSIAVKVGQKVLYSDIIVGGDGILVFLDGHIDITIFWSTKSI